MNFFNFFRKSPPLLGANLDTRSVDERNQDYHIKEIVASFAAVDWQELPADTIRQFPVQNQNGKSDCVAETRRKLFRILFKVNRNLDLDFSSVELYRRRSNYPAPGMGSDDAISLTRNQGMTLNALVPSDEITTEEAANAIAIKTENTNIAKVFTIPNEVIFTSGDLETVASTIQKTRKGVMVWFYFIADEWSREVPIILDKKLSLYDARSLRHSITGIEPAMYKGKKGVWIEDSAHFGNLSRRFITEEFYQIRNFFASYPINFKFEVPALPRPTYDGSIVSLQDCLKFEECFPSNVESTGVFGPVTRDAVKKFQAKYGLEQVGTVGPLTTQQLKSLYP